MARKKRAAEDSGEDGGFGAVTRIKLNTDQITERAVKLARLGAKRDEHVAKYKIVQEQYRTQLKRMDVERARLQREVNEGCEEVSAQQKLFSEE